MVKRIFTPADIQSIAVGQERFTAVCLDIIGNGLGPVGTQKRQVARLTKVQLDSRILFIKVQCAHARLIHQPPQFLLQVFG